MKEITYFYMKGCPHCKKADGFIAELTEENPKYATIKINKIEERENAAIADTFDYFYVPAMFVEGKKLHEGASTKEAIEAVLNAAL